MSHGKAGAVGVLAILGLVIVRNADTCVSAGARGARVAGRAGDEAIAGSRAVWGVEDAARLGGRAEAASAAGRLGGASVEAGHGAEVAGDVLGAGLDVALEAIDLAGPEDEAPSLATLDGSEGGRTRCPRTVDATVSDDAWQELLGGFGVACAPILVVGVQGDAPMGLRIGDREHAMSKLARDCLGVGAQCMFVACPRDAAAACFAASERSLYRASLTENLFAYERDVVEGLLAQDPAPIAIAVPDLGGERPRLVVARP